jgi:O-antigen ligase
LRYVTTYWALALLPMLPAAMRVGSRPEYLRQFLWTLFAFGVPMTVLGLMQLSTSQRLEVFGASTIEVSRTALLVPLVWVAFVLRRRGLLVRAATLLLVPAAVVVAVASGSRGPLLALVLLGFIGAIRHFSRLRRVNWRIAGAIAGVALASIVAVSAFGNALPSLSIYRFTLFEDFLGQLASGDSLNTSVGGTSIDERVVLFEAAVAMFDERPVLGFGTGGFEAASPRFTGPPFYAYPHNAVLQFAAEFGFVGVALFAGLVFVALKRPFPRNHLGNAVVVALAFFLLNAMVSDDIYGGRPMWGLFALVLLISLPKVESEVVGPQLAGAPSRIRQLPASAIRGS